jgi:anti-sigma B factor antagonist
MDFEEAKDGEVAILGPVGSLNTQSSPAFEQKILALLTGGSRRIVVDLRSVDIVTSAALRVLLVAGRRLNSGGIGRVVLCGLNEEVRKVFSISGFDRDFAIVAHRGEAIARAGEALPQASPGTTPRGAPPGTTAPTATKTVPPPPLAEAPPPPHALAEPVIRIMGGRGSEPWAAWEGESSADSLRSRVEAVLGKTS